MGGICINNLHTASCSQTLNPDPPMVFNFIVGHCIQNSPVLGQKVYCPDIVPAFHEPPIHARCGMHRCCWARAELPFPFPPFTYPMFTVHCSFLLLLFPIHNFLSLRP